MMATGFTNITGHAVAMLEDKIDTDIIFPARYLLHMEREGLGAFLFADRREQADAAFAIPAGVESRPSVLLAGSGFGCGSSREHAVWSLLDYGFRAVIAPDFGEIFAANAIRNGLATLTMDPECLSRLANCITSGPFVIDLPRRTILATDGSSFSFFLDDADCKALINGWDMTDIILEDHGAVIDAFEYAYRQRHPWAIPIPIVSSPSCYRCG